MLFSGLFYFCYMKNISNRIESQLWSQLDSQLGLPLWSQLDAQLKNSI